MNNQLLNDLIKKGMSPTLAQNVCQLSADHTQLEDLLYLWVDQQDINEADRMLSDIKTCYKNIVAS